MCSIGPSGFSRYVRVPHPVDDGGVGEEHPDGIALANLLRVLGRHTSTSQDCFFGLWDGYGHVHGGSAVAVLYTTRRPRWRDLWRQGPQLSVPAAFPAEVVQGPRSRTGTTCCSVGRYWRPGSGEHEARHGRTRRPEFRT